MKKRMNECPSCHKVTLQIETEVPRWRHDKESSILTEKVWVCQNCYSLITTKKVIVAYPDYQNYNLSN